MDGNRLNNAQLWHEYTVGKQSYKQLAERYFAVLKQSKDGLIVCNLHTPNLQLSDGHDLFWQAFARLNKIALLFKVLRAMAGVGL